MSTRVMRTLLMCRRDVSILILATIVVHVSELLPITDDNTISLALIATAPVPPAPGLAAGGGIGVDWWTHHSGGTLRQACSKPGLSSFTPLCVMKTPRRSNWDRTLRALHFRDSPDSIEDPYVTSITFTRR